MNGNILEFIREYNGLGGIKYLLFCISFELELNEKETFKDFS
jgi:hypothetical protein